MAMAYPLGVNQAQIVRYMNIKKIITMIVVDGGYVVFTLIR